MIEKCQRFHHSVTENGNLQLRIVTEYIQDGKIKDIIPSLPMTPADVNNMTGWDDRSKDIVAVIIDGKIKADFDAEFWTVNGEPNPLETLMEIITYDRVIEEDGKIAVRRITRIYDEGIEVSKKYHRSWIMPGQDPTGNDVISKAVADKIHISGVIIAYKNKLASIEEQTV